MILRVKWAIVEGGKRAFSKCNWPFHWSQPITISTTLGPAQSTFATQPTVKAIRAPQHTSGTVVFSAVSISNKHQTSYSGSPVHLLRSRRSPPAIAAEDMASLRVVSVLVLVAMAASAGGVAARPLVGVGGAWENRAPLQTSRPFNIAHRGSNGELPEETAAAYARAIDEGADFIEADIEATKDGHLVCFHDTTLDGTTDVAHHPEFAGRRRTLEVQWANVTGYFVSTWTVRRPLHASCRSVVCFTSVSLSIHLVVNTKPTVAADFTLVELKTLRAKQRWDFRDKSHNGEQVDPVSRPARPDGRSTIISCFLFPLNCTNNGVHRQAGLVFFPQASRRSSRSTSSSTSR